MDYAFSISTPFLTPFSIQKVNNRHLDSPTRFNSFSRPPFSLRTVYVVSPLFVNPRLECVSNSVAYFHTLCATQRAPDAIVLNVGGMTRRECVSSVKRILENNAQVYVASVYFTSETAIVWPVAKAKVDPNWYTILGNELANDLTFYCFNSNLQELDTFHGCFKNTPFTDWPGHTFASLAPLDSELESHAKEVDALKVKVKNLLLGSTIELTDNIQFINLLCRLGVSHHFEDEIEEQLEHVFSMLPKFVEDNDYDLCTVANFFRVLRQHGYNIVTCDVFNKFQDGNGEFKKDIANDVKGLLCLYEACFLAIRGDGILDEAHSFTRKCLKVLAENASVSLQIYIRHVLMFPSHHTAERIDSLHYISHYEEDESANETLLRFAKLDFNGMQLLYRKELACLSKWWNDANALEKLPYTRDRFVESFLWAIGSIYEPQYSLSRRLIAKYTQLITFLDDTYDSCGIVEHLQLLTDSLQRLTIDATSDELPEYIKHICLMLIEDFKYHNGMKGCTFDESENKDTNGYSYKTSYVEEMLKEYVRGILVEAKWKKEGKAPLFHEYMRNGRMTCAFESLASIFIYGVQNMGMKEILWVRNHPEIVIATQFIGRLTNDLIGLKDEKERQDFPKAVDCYIEQYGVLEDKAVEAIRKIIDSKWKVMNEELMKPSNIPRILLKYALNFCRMTLVINGGDSDIYTYPTNSNELIVSMLLKPFPV